MGWRREQEALDYGESEKLYGEKGREREREAGREGGRKRRERHVSCLVAIFSHVKSRGDMSRLV